MSDNNNSSKPLFDKTAWENAWSDYNALDAKVAQAKKDLIAAETARCEACKVIAEMVPGGGKKLARDGQQLTVVVRYNKTLGRDTYFFRGKGKDDDVFQG